MKRFTVLALSVVLAACDPVNEATPVAPSALSMQSFAAAGFAVYPFLLAPAEGSGSTAWGEVVVRVGTRLPPNPCTDRGVLPGGSTGLTFCGVLHNPGGETLQGATFRVSDPDGALIPVQVRFEAPPNPCLTAFFRGSVGLVGQNPGPPGVEVELVTDAGALVGANPGPPIVEKNPGPPSVEKNPGPPTCEIGTASPIDR